MIEFISKITLHRSDESFGTFFQFYDYLRE